MNKKSLMMMTVLVLLPGCFSKNKRTQPRTTNRDALDMEIPVADSSVKNFFENDLDTLALQDQPFTDLDDSAAYAWLESGKKSQGFTEVLFDFDKYTIRSSEKEKVAQNIARMKEMLAQEKTTGKQVQFVINGHTDKFGSDSYNDILSENRAKTFADHAVAAGIPRDRIKIVGRGSHIPAVVNGQPILHGSVAQQAPNRRDEVMTIVARA